MNLNDDSTQIFAFKAKTTKLCYRNVIKEPYTTKLQKSSKIGTKATSTTISQSVL